MSAFGTRLTSAAAVAGAITLLAAGGTPTRQPPAPVLRTVADVPLPGPPVRFDYQSLDTGSNRLYGWI
jgi:hypothetical protein